MKKSIYSLTIFLLLSLLASLTLAQTPVAKIKIEGYSPQEVHDLGLTSPRSTGLQVVGVGQVVYLVGRDSLNAPVTTYTWSLPTKPGGSTTVLDSTNKRQTTFKPDVEGKFTAQLVINTAGGASAPRTVTITSAKFVGVGLMDGLPVDVNAGQCALCHNANFVAWTKTAHSTMFTRGIDGTASDHYGESCIECHTTGFDDSPGAVNDGFDDVADELGWVFPATLQAGNWADIKANYPKLAHRANIQCESCHGPGSLHKGLDKTAIAMSLDEAACGYCHEEEPYHRISTQWKNSTHSDPHGEFESVANRPASSGCANCHSGWGFIRRIDPRTPDNRPTNGFSQISCAVCHDPHRDTLLPSQVRTLNNVQLGDTLTVVNYGGMGKICMQCHIARRDAADYVNNPSNLSTHFGPHYSNQADMLDGSNAFEYGLPTGGSGHKFAIADACVTCHMQETPATGQPGHDKVGGHTYAMRDDNGTPDDHSDDVEHVAICQTCHGPIESFDDILAKADFDEDGTIEGTRHEIEGLVHKLDELLPPRSTTAEVNANYKWAAGDPPEKIEARKRLAQAWYNFLFVEEDRSFGAHNAAYSINILRRSIASLTTGSVGATEIISITDVPNDQGKQVRLAWDGFPGDGVATDPVVNYSLWRRVDDVAGKVSSEELPNKEALFTAAIRANLGKRFKVAKVSGWWDFVDLIPASSQDVYSIVAPTLYDSSASGAHWSVFYVAGHRRSGQTVETAPDSGYSIDNLAPEAPANIVASGGKTLVTLSWDDPVDEDFKYFAIYRSTSSGFDPKAIAPLAAITGTEYNDNAVVVGTRYYYRVSTYDFAGNQSAFSPEFSALVTSVDQGGSAIPTEFALEQNYPNPFNPETRIEYQLPTPGNVRLVIFTVLGQEVRKLVDRELPAAYHEVVWDGRDNAGNPVPSGIYFYRIESGSFRAIKKMLLMK